MKKITTALTFVFALGLAAPSFAAEMNTPAIELIAKDKDKDKDKKKKKNKDAKACSADQKANSGCCAKSAEKSSCSSKAASPKAESAKK